MLKEICKTRFFKEALLNTMLKLVHLTTWLELNKATLFKLTKESRLILPEGSGLRMANIMDQFMLFGEIHLTQRTSSQSVIGQQRSGMKTCQLQLCKQDIINLI